MVKIPKLKLLSVIQSISILKTVQMNKSAQYTYIKIDQDIERKRPHFAEISTVGYSSFLLTTLFWAAEYPLGGLQWTNGNYKFENGYGTE